MDKDDLIWLAGIFDGKQNRAFFKVGGRSGHKREYIALEVHSAAKDLVEEVAELWEVSVNKNKKSFKARVSGAKAVQIAKELFPFIRSKKLRDSFSDVINDYA